LKKEIEEEFNNFLLIVTKAIGSKLTDIFPKTAVEKVCSGFSGESFRNILEGIVITWNGLGNNKTINGNYEEAITILLIQMIGPLNQLSLPDNVESKRLFHAYLTILDRMLQDVKLKKKFAVILEQALKAA